MSEWQDKLCPYCGEWCGHSDDCYWPDKQTQNEARRASGESVASILGIDRIAETEDGLLAALKGYSDAAPPDDELTELLNDAAAL